MVTQFGTGQTASHTPQPQQASMFASYKPSGVTSKQVSGHCSQHSVHLMQVSKSTTGRKLRVLNFLKYFARSGWRPPVLPLLASVIAFPSGRQGMEMPSPISCHLGNSNLYGISGFPWFGFTFTEVARWWAFSADCTFTGSCHSSMITF